MDNTKYTEEQIEWAFVVDKIEKDKQSLMLRIKKSGKLKSSL